MLDADSGNGIGKIGGFKRNHGVAVVSDLGRGFVTDGDAAEVVVFDLRTLKTTGRIKAETDADSILYYLVSSGISCLKATPIAAP